MKTSTYSLLYFDNKLESDFKELLNTNKLFEALNMTLEELVDFIDLDYLYAEKIVKKLVA